MPQFSSISSPIIHEAIFLANGFYCGCMFTAVQKQLSFVILLTKGPNTTNSKSINSEINRNCSLGHIIAIKQPKF